MHRGAHMIRQILLAAAVLTLATGAEARRYGMLDYSCARPPEGLIVTGDGWLTLTETRYTRQGDKTDIGDGWIAASYSAEAEGETLPPVRLELQITPETVRIRHPDGRRFEGRVCP